MTRFEMILSFIIAVIIFIMFILLIDFAINKSEPIKYNKNDIIKLIDNSKASDIRINNRTIEFKDDESNCTFYLFYSYDEALELEKRFGEKYRYNMYRYRNILFYTDDLMKINKYIKKIQEMDK